MSDHYYLVRHQNGKASVASSDLDEVMHPIVGPEIEATTLYVDGLCLPRRLEESGKLCVWDVGMGAAANALMAAQALRGQVGELHIISFDHTTDALRFALGHAVEFNYLRDCVPHVEILLGGCESAFELGQLHVNWTFLEGDFPTTLSALPQGVERPHAIFYDAWSPLKNPGMWTLEVFRQLYRALGTGPACSLATYSRATCIRSALLLAGFFVGAGGAVGAKEESTIAATDPVLLKSKLPASWLKRAENSHSGRPLLEDKFQQARLPGPMMERLRNHPQFK